MKAVLFAAGELTPSDWLLARCREAQLLIAVDGGLKHMLAAGLRPDLLVGDLDSVTRAELEQAGQVERLTFPSDKSLTDLELALQAALARGVTEVVVAAALGARQDHTLANLLLAARWQEQGQMRLCLTGAATIAWPVSAGDELTLPCPPGTTFSVIAATADCRISIRGARYELDGAELPFGTGLGISNVVNADCWVSGISGTVLVMVSTDEI